MRGRGGQKSRRRPWPRHHCPATPLLRLGDGAAAGHDYHGDDDGPSSRRRHRRRSGDDAARRRRRRCQGRGWGGLPPAVLPAAEPGGSRSGRRARARARARARSASLSVVSRSHPPPLQLQRPPPPPVGRISRRRRLGIFRRWSRRFR